MLPKNIFMHVLIILLYCFSCFFHALFVQHFSNFGYFNCAFHQHSRQSEFLIRLTTLHVLYSINTFVFMVLCIRSSTCGWERRSNSACGRLSWSGSGRLKAGRDCVTSIPSRRRSCSSTSCWIRPPRPKLMSHGPASAPSAHVGTSCAHRCQRWCGRRQRSV